MTPNIESFIDEFLTSANFSLISPDLKEHTPTLLAVFAHACAGRNSIGIADIDDALSNRFAKLDLSLPIRRAIPGLLRDFFGFLADSGRYPPAREWIGLVDSLDARYQAKFRGDGSVKGETFTKKYTDVNRNDPCPCGSGKKFKKCCG